MVTANELTDTVRVEIPAPHSEEQASFVRSVAMRQIIRAGRRFGKTVGSAIKAVEAFCGLCPACGGVGCSYCKDTGKVKPCRVLYAAPTSEQVTKFWFEVTRALSQPVSQGYLKKDESLKYIERPQTDLRLQARTAWNASALRGGYWDLLILEEFQLMNEDTWEEVGQPMLVDTNGRAVFIYTPPSLKTEGISKARDPRHAAKMFKKALADKTGQWETFHFTTYQNPTLNREAIARISADMSKESYRREILAEDDEIQLSWLVYKTFNEMIRKVARFEIPIEWPVYSGHDFGTANPAALFFAQVKLPLPTGAPSEMRYGDLVAFKEYLPGGGYSTPQHVEAFRGIVTGYSVAESRGGSHQEAEIRGAYGAHGWNILEPMRKEVSWQLDRVIGLFELNKVWVFNDLYNWFEELMNCLWIPDNEGRPTNKIKDEAKYHLSACARYILSSFIPETIVGDKIKVKAVSYI